jgi:hypothetical protein
MKTNKIDLDRRKRDDTTQSSSTISFLPGLDSNPNPECCYFLNFVIPQPGQKQHNIIRLVTHLIKLNLTAQITKLNPSSELHTNSATKQN